MPISWNIFSAVALSICLIAPIAHGMKKDKPKNYRPDGVSKMCVEEAKDPSNEYGESTYVATTYIIAHLAGYKELDAYTLGFYSRYPDEDTNFSAKHLEYINMLTPWRWDWRDRIKDTLHALHGGDAEKIAERQQYIEKVASKLLAKRKPNFWHTGIILHAYGDSFMHIEGLSTDTERVAREGLIGEPHRLFVAEQIAHPEVFPKYLDYTDHLFQLLNKANKGKGNTRAYNTFKAQMTALACKSDDQCDDPEFEKMDAFMANMATQFSYDLKIYNCMKDKGRLLYESEMKEILDTLETE